MREQDALRLPRAAGGVLDEGRVVRGRRHGPPRLADHVFGGHHRVEGRHLAHEQAGDARHVAERHEDARARVAQDGHLAADVLLDAVEAERRIQGDRYAAGHQRADEGREEPLLGPQHDGDRVAAAEPVLGEAPRDGLRLVPQPAVGEGGLLSGFLAQVDVGAFGRALGVPGQRFDDRPGVRRGRDSGPARGASCRAALLRGVVGFRDGRGEVCRRLRVRHRRVPETDAERAFEADQQLDAFQAADAEVGLERVAARHGGRYAAAQLGHEFGDDGEDLLLDAPAGGR